MTNPLITYHVNTFNNLFFIKNLIMSFKECNVYDNYEWIITDHGSEDYTKDFLDELSLSDSVTLMTKPESAKRERLTDFKGDYLIKLTEFCQFIRKGDWVSEYIRLQQSAKESIIPVYYGEPLPVVGNSNDWGNYSTDYYVHKNNEVFGSTMIFFKYPFVVCFPSTWSMRLGMMMRHYSCDQTAVPIFEEGELQSKFADLERPVSSDEMILIKGIR